MLQNPCERRFCRIKVSFKIYSGISIHALLERCIAKNDHCFEIPHQPYLLFRLFGYDLGSYLKLFKFKSSLCHWLFQFEYYKFGIYSKDITWQRISFHLKRRNWIYTRMDIVANVRIFALFYKVRFYHEVNSLATRVRVRVYLHGVDYTSLYINQDKIVYSTTRCSKHFSRALSPEHSALYCSSRLT